MYVYILFLAFISIKRGIQDKPFGVQVDITLPFPSVPCLFVEEITEEGHPRPLTPSLVVAFCDPQRIRWQYSCGLRHRPSCCAKYFSLQFPLGILKFSFQGFCKTRLLIHMLELVECINYIPFSSVIVGDYFSFF